MLTLGFTNAVDDTHMYAHVYTDGVHSMMLLLLQLMVMMIMNFNDDDDCLHNDDDCGRDD